MSLTPEQIAALYDEHAPALLRYIARRTFEPEIAVDLLSETFAKAIAERRRFRGSSDQEIVGWLYAIARNLVVDHGRRVVAERTALGREGRRRPLDDDEYERIERLLDLRSIRDTVAEALDELPRQHREVLRLRIVEERSYAELAAAIGTTELAARVRLSRALAALRSLPAITRLREELRHA